MKPEDRDLAYLWDMRGCALERSLELLGEAAQRVSSSFQSRNAQIEWRSLVGQRNVLACEYGLIDHRRLYDSARLQIPPLLDELERILKDAL